MELSISTTALSAAGSKVGATSDPASLGSRALSGLSIPAPAFGTGIGSAAAQFASELASRCTELATAAAGQGSAITQAAQTYTAVDQGAAAGFAQLYTASMAI